MSTILSRSSRRRYVAETTNSQTGCNFQLTVDRPLLTHACYWLEYQRFVVESDEIKDCTIVL